MTSTATFECRIDDSDMATRELLSLLFLFSVHLFPAACFDVTEVPPLLNGPVFSLATRTTTADDSNAPTSNMNIVTYASPVSIRPKRLWTVGLYKETLSYQNFKKAGKGVLQLLTQDHIPIIRILGGSSGGDVDKQDECYKLGFKWKEIASEKEDYPLVLPKCKSYLLVELVGDLIDGGSHDIAICRITKMFSDSEEAHLETQYLRDCGIITAQGRIADQ